MSSYICRKNVHVKIVKVVKIKMVVAQIVVEIDLHLQKMVVVKVQDNVTEKEFVYLCKTIVII